jgi:prepilin-type processing-associated H-X9-DG protein
VISIITLLVSILVPALSKARERTRALVCTHNLKSLSLAWFAYATDNNGRLIGGNTGESLHDWVHHPTGTSSNPIEQKKEGVRQGALFGYVKTVKVYHCPSDKRFKDPSQQTFRSYSIAGGMNGKHEYGAGRSVEIYTDIKGPVGKYVFVEENDPRGFNERAWHLNPSGDSWGDPLAIWHNNKSTLGFADGHAELHTWRDQRTIEFSNGGYWGISDAYQPDNPDLKYMQAGYAIIR